MAFPTIPSAGRVLQNTQANTTAVRTFPSLSGLTKNSGDLLIAICVVYQSSASGGAVFSGWSAGWTEFADLGGTTSNMSIGCAYKFSTGAETGTIAVTQAATITGHAAMCLLSIPGAHLSTPPEVSTIVHGTTTAANTAALNPAGWGTEDTLWVAVAGTGETATTLTFTGVGAPPTNYGDTQFGSTSADAVGGVEMAVAFRQLNAASEDPGAWSVDVSQARNSAILIAVRPPAVQTSITLVQETDTAQAVSGTTHVSSITTATETDLVGEIVPLQTLPALATASAQPLSTQSGHGITTSTTTASAQALDVDKKVTITPAAETDSAVSRNKIITFVTETDTAVAVALQHATYDVTPATETDLAGDIIELQTLPASETAAPQVLSFSQSGLHLTPATSTASAQLLSFTQGGGYSIGRATETDLANTIVSLQPLPATVTASAQALEVIYGGKNIAPAQESDSARSITPGAGINLVEWETTAPLPYNTKVAVGDLSTAVALTKTSGVGSSKNILPAVTNYVQNPSLEVNTTGWQSYNGGVISRVTSEAHSGSASLQVVCAANFDGTAYAVYDTAELGGTYTFSVWVKAAVGEVFYLDADGNVSGITNINGTGDWQQVSLQLVSTNVGGTGAEGDLRVYIASRLTGAQTFWVDDAQVVSAKTDIAQALTHRKAVPNTLVSETSTAQALTHAKSRSIVPVTQTTVALGLSFFLQGTHYVFDPAVSTNTAVQLSIFKLIFVSLSPVIEHDAARLTRAANRPSGGLALIDHEPNDVLALTDHTQTPDLVLIDL